METLRQAQGERPIGIGSKSARSEKAGTATAGGSLLGPACDYQALPGTLLRGRGFRVRQGGHASGAHRTAAWSRLGAPRKTCVNPWGSRAPDPFPLTPARCLPRTTGTPDSASPPDRRTPPRPALPEGFPFRLGHLETHRHPPEGRAVVAVVDRLWPVYSRIPDGRAAFRDRTYAFCSLVCSSLKDVGRIPRVEEG
jgi:hypothetical protein